MGIDTDIRQYEAQIQRLRSEMIMLKNKKKQLENQRERYKSLLAPVRRLPTEVLHHVFVTYAHMNYLFSFWKYLPGQKIMSVCARWRDIAKSCSALWTKIMMGIDSESIEDENRITTALRWCLERSGSTAPLDIALQGTLPDDVEELEYCTLLASQAARWREVSVTTDSDLATLLPSLFDTEEPSFPLLEILHLAKRNSVGAQDAPELELFRRAPKLHELSISCAPDMDIDKALFPWTQIKTLNVRYRDDVSHISPSIFPELETLSYDISALVPREIPDFPLHTSNTLHTLSFHLNKMSKFTGPPKAFEKFLVSASYPALKKMVVDFDPLSRYNAPAVVGQDIEDLLWPQSEMTSFILRSSCSLTFLQLKDPFITTYDLITLLLHTPSLSHFELYQAHRRNLTEEEQSANKQHSRKRLEPLTTAWIKRLHAHSIEGSCDFNNPLLPKLINLSLTVLGDWFDDDQLFVDVILSRWVSDPSLALDFGISCLKSVELKIWGRLLDEKVYEPLVQLGKLGMKVELSSEIPPTPP